MLPVWTQLSHHSWAVQHLMSKSSPTLLSDAPPSSQLIKKEWLSHICRRLGKCNKAPIFFRVWGGEEGRRSRAVYLVSCSSGWDYWIVSFVWFMSSPSVMRVSRGAGHTTEEDVFVYLSNTGKQRPEKTLNASVVLPRFPPAASFRPRQILHVVRLNIWSLQRVG